MISGTHVKGADMVEGSTFGRLSERLKAERPELDGSTYTQMLPSDVVSHLAYSIVLVPEVLPTLDELEASATIARGRLPREWWARSMPNRCGVEAPRNA